MYQILLLYNNVSNTIHYNNVSNIIVITSALKSTAVINLVGHSVAIKSSTVREVNCIKIFSRTSNSLSPTY